MLEIRTGCRLHFGLMELAEGEPLRFGGLGLMVSSPLLGLRISRTENHQTDARRDRCYSVHTPPGPDASETARRIGDVVQLHTDRQASTGSCCLSSYHIEVFSALPLHNGLGTGTQLASAVAAGLEIRSQIDRQAVSTADPTWRPCSEIPELSDAQQLAQRAGRGLRSAVGLHGFLHGGLILDRGHGPGDSPPDSARTVDTRSVAVPSQWRVVLVRPSPAKLVCGQTESEKLSQIGRSPNPNRSNMLDLAQQAMRSLGPDADLDHFTSLLTTYMRQAAEIFVPEQGGLYNGPQISLAVKLAEQAKLRGVGQSSWGPTVFGFASCQRAAVEAAEWLRRQRPCSDWEIAIAEPNFTGAQWRWVG